MKKKIASLLIVVVSLVLLHTSCQHAKKTENSKIESNYVGEILLKNLKINDLAISPSKKKLVYTSDERREHRLSQVYVYDLDSRTENRMTFQGGKAINPFFSNENRIVFSSNTDFLKEKPDSIYKLGEEFYNIYEVDPEKNITRLTSGIDSEIGYLVFNDKIYFTKGKNLRKSDFNFKRVSTNIDISDHYPIESVFLVDDTLFFTNKINNEIYLNKIEVNQVVNIKVFSSVQSFYESDLKLLFLLSSDGKKIEFYNIKENCIGSVELVTFKDNDKIKNFSFDLKNQIAYLVAEISSVPGLFKTRLNATNFVCKTRP